MSHCGLLHHMIINVSDVKRSSPFYTSMFRYEPLISARFEFNALRSRFGGLMTFGKD